MTYFASVTFDDVHELTEFMASPDAVVPKKSPWFGDNTSAVENDNDHGWYASRSFGEAIRFARDGWPEGRERVQQAVDTLTPYVQAAVRLPSETLSVAGYAPNVPAYCSGSPACMYNSDGDDMTGRAPVVRFLVNISCSWSVDSEALFNRGAALCACVDYLEASGQSCEIELVSRQQAGSTAQDFRVTLKKAGEALDRDRVVFFLSNVSVFRRFVFRVQELDPLVYNGFSSGRGFPTDVEPEYQQVYLQAALGGWLNSACETPQEAMRYVLKRVQESMDPREFARVSEDWEQILDGLR